MTERRRLLLMRHGAVEYFAPDGRPFLPTEVPLTATGIEQARAIGAALANGAFRIDRIITSGLVRTRSSAEQVMAAGPISAAVEHWPEFEEIRGGRLGAIPEAQLREAFLGAFEGPVPLGTQFLGGETVGELLDRVVPALERLLEAKDWDTVLLVLHGGVNRALLSWLLTGQRMFFGGFEQSPGCLNVIDVGASAASHIVRLLNYSPLDTLHTSTRLSTMEALLARYESVRGGMGAAPAGSMHR
ncbi:MAG TPA: histidine phosphatase family protein [Burkholderiaceae bacterium]|nr:histidine phosphatase family protein [Burkholderiaceae bacterium]